MPLDDAYTTTEAGDRASDQPVFPIPESALEISISKIGWGGPRANSGGARPNSGGPRANSGGSRPGAGRPRKAPEPQYATDEPMWRVFATWGQAEISATRELTRQGYETYLPLVAIRRRDAVIWSHFHIVRVPMCPGYGFIRLTQSEAREPVLLTKGVRELLHLPNGRLSLVPDREIQRLLDDEESRLQLPKETRPVLAVDTVVRIEEGPFVGFPGVVKECDGVRTRVEAEVFGRLTPIWLDRAAVVEIEV